MYNCLFSQVLSITFYTDPISKRIYEIISYCLRPSENDNYRAAFIFAQLKKKNITGEMSLSWSISVDLAEEYDFFFE
jgi:hypothetical protein